MVKLDQDIQPLSEFKKHISEFIDRVNKDKRSIVLTKRGKGTAVLIDISEYQNMLDKLSLMEEIIEAEKEIARGEVATHSEAKKEIKQNLKKWK